MNSWISFWLIVFGASAVLFFAVALVVAIRGVGDLRELLKKTERRSQGPPVDRD